MKIKITFAAVRPYLLLVSILGLLVVARMGLAATISCGLTVSNATAYASENDQYFFPGSAGQLLSVGFYWSYDLSSQSGTADIYNPAGQWVTSVSGRGDGAATNLTLASSGTYTILVHSTTYNSISAYSLSLQSPSDGGCDGPTIACGQTVQTSIGTNAEIDAYGFVGSAGQLVSVGFYWRYDLSSQSGTADIYNPAGQWVTSVSGRGDGAATNLTLASSGTYTILVHSTTYNSISAYSLSLQSPSDGGCDSPTIACGQTVQTSIGTNAEIDAYGFVGSAGQVVSAGFSWSYGLSSQSGTADIYNPAGQWVTSVSGRGDGAATNLTLASSGTYTILVHSTTYNSISAYGLSLQLLVGGGCGKDISCGQSVNGRIRDTSQMDSYQFEAGNGEQVLLSDSGFTGMVVNVYDPTGSNVVNIGVDASTNHTFAVSGTYTVLVHSGDYAGTGSYSLTMTVLAGCTPLSLDQTVISTQEVGCVPLELVSSSPVVWLSFTVQAPTNVLGTPTLETSGQFISNTITAGTNSQWYVTMQTSPTNGVTGDQIIGSLCFTPMSTQSLFVPVVLSSLFLSNQEGTVPGGVPSGGRVVVIANQSLLQVGITNRQPVVTLYGKADTLYEIDYTTNLAVESSWSALSTNTLPSSAFSTVPVQGSLSNAPALFFRGLEK